MVIPSPEWFAQGLRLLRQGFRAARRQATHDHSAIWGGWFTSPVVQTYGTRFFVTVACAPSEKFRRPLETSTARVEEFLREYVPLPFPAQPFQSYPGMVMFEEPDTDHLNPRRHAARVLGSGLVELIIHVPHETDAQGRMTLDLVTVFQPVVWLLEAVRSGGYQRLFKLRTRMRLLDWYVALTPSVSGYPSGSHTWNDLRFPGQRPNMRGTQEVAPNRPLAVERLRNRRQSTRPDRVLGEVITALVRESGWDGDDVPKAVADCLEALLPH